MKSKISFLTIKKVYNLFGSVENHKFDNPKHEYFKRVFCAHLINSMWAYCAIYTNLIQRNNPLFNNGIIEKIAEEAAGTLKITKGLYIIYSEYIKKNKEIKQDSIAISLLNSGADIKDICYMVSILVSESLIDQIELITTDDCAVLAEYTCKCILSNLSNPIIKPYLIADSTSKEIVISIFSIMCLFCTFLPSKVKKKNIGNYTTEGILIRSGIKYTLSNDMIYLSPRGGRLDKYRTREMYTEIYALFSSLFVSYKLFVSHTSKSTTGLTMPLVDANVIDHSSVGSKNSVEITDTEVFDDIRLTSNSSNVSKTNSATEESKSSKHEEEEKNEQYFSCFSIFIIFYKFLSSLIKRRDKMGTSQSKQKKTYSDNKSANTFFKEDERNEDNSEVSDQKTDNSSLTISNVSKKKNNKLDTYPDDYQISFVDIEAKYGDKKVMRK